MRIVSVPEVRSRIPRLLRGHARTMEISIRLLPRSLREPLGLAYLLARASDTVADAGWCPSEEREAWVSEALCLLEAGLPEKIPGVPRKESCSEKERDLLAWFPSLLKLLSGSPDRYVISGLWREIMEGQLFDLRRFRPGAPPLDREELERYCDLVAGSVGRCWTRLIASHCPRILHLPIRQMIPLASDYGKGLQLVNILRDRAEDGAAGRIYVRAEEVREKRSLASQWLDAGERYLEALRPGRILTASSLPLGLAKATMELLAEDSPGGCVKLSRQRVRIILLSGLASLWLPYRANPAS